MLNRGLQYRTAGQEEKAQGWVRLEPVLEVNYLAKGPGQE